MRHAPRVMAIASAGGHFVQLCRLMPAFRGCDLVIVSTDPQLRTESEAVAEACDMPRPDFRTVTEANRWQKARLLRSALEIIWTLAAVRPDVVVTTGAAPGFLAVRLAAAFGIKTAWIDSIANADVMSLSGERAGKHVDLWLTQWEHLARPDGPHYRGAVL